MSGRRLGIDVGSWGVKSDDGERPSARAHLGDIEATLVAGLDRSIDAVGFTGVGGKGLAEAVGAAFVDVPLALASCPDRPPEVRHILDLGAGSSTWIHGALDPGVGQTHWRWAPRPTPLPGLAPSASVRVRCSLQRP